jgi:cytochrome bd ubiquinol oxidase subunit I
MDDALLLARIQFAANISFHILFPSITIALGWFLLAVKLRFQVTKDPKWMAIYMFWVKVFALSFALGVVSGITMSFQFGTNWPGFMERVGNVAGPLLAYEILTAFFLEAVFLGIMLFGATRVPAWVHTGATALVAFGTTMSAFWIIVLNSWMHTPAGYELREGVVFATDWWAIVFNPSMPYRLSHTLVASGLTVAFLVAGIGALRLLWGDRSPATVASVRTGMWMGAVLIPIQIVLGDLHGLNTLEHQPAKVAAMEGNWETQGNVPLLLFALPDEEARTNRFEVGIPSMASIILKHDPEGVIPGLNDFVAEDGTVLHPPVAPVFWSFRVMVGTGVAMLLVSWAAVAYGRRRSPEQWARPFLGVVALMAFSGWVATLAGWYTTEIGRQPWLVTGVLDTASAAGDVAPTLIAGSLAVYLAVYGALLVAYIATILHMARQSAFAGRLPRGGQPQAGAPLAGAA